MRFQITDPVKNPSDVYYNRCTIDLRTGKMTQEEVPCRNLEDVLGGFGRSFQMLAERHIEKAYCDENPLIVGPFLQRCHRDLQVALLALGILTSNLTDAIARARKGLQG